jgi:small subunit ribosomal protein S20
MQMPQHKSAAKRIKTSGVRRHRNRPRMARVRKAVKTVRTASGKEAATGALLEAVSQLDKAGAKGTVHKNKASRLKSRLTKAVNAMQS